MPADAAAAHSARRVALGPGLSHLTNANVAICGSATTAKAADIGDFRRRNVHGSAKTLDPVGGGVHVVDPDISDPARRRAHSLRVLRQVHQPADRGLTGGK